MDMFDLLAHRARVTPERPALEDLESGERYNYAQFNERAARLAAAARDHWGLNEGDRLAYLGHSRAEFFAMLFGCAKAGLILVPLNWRLAVPELEVLVEDCDPGALIFGAEFADAAAELQQRRSPWWRWTAPRTASAITTGISPTPGRTSPPTRTRARTPPGTCSTPPAPPAGPRA